MTTETVVLDSNIIIDYLQGRYQAAKLFQSYRNNNIRVVISIITLIEVLVGIADQEKRGRVKQWLLNFSPIHVCLDIAEKAIELRKGYGLRLPDALIASTARCHQGILVTRDRDFYKMSDVRYPYDLHDQE
ncbi:MAG: type II toxin-antitoxin system VapC family toxin [Alphaproteobacteria bacterium]|nr:type II toxin-antitoxin system VapC family toxin [Alphaproteobacteria bacterium]